MWKYGIFSTSSILGIIFNLFAVSEGFECYACAVAHELRRDHVENVTAQKVQASCKLGKSPHISLRQHCMINEYAVDKENPPVCIMLYTERPSRGNFTLLKYFETLRMRLPGMTPELIKKGPGCFELTYRDLIAIPGLESTLQYLACSAGPVSEDTSTHFCYCKGDNCNSMQGGSRSG